MIFGIFNEGGLMWLKQSIFFCCLVTTCVVFGMDNENTEKRKSPVPFVVQNLGDQRKSRSSQNLKKYRYFHQKAMQANMSMYRHCCVNAEWRKSMLGQYFDNDEPQPNTLDILSKSCTEFNLAVMFLVIEKNYECLKILFEMYEISDSFLKCRSEKNDKNFLHYLFEHVDDQNVQYIIYFVNKILQWHPTLLNNVDKEAKVPLWYLGNACDTLQHGKETREAVQEIIKNYGQLFIVPKTLSVYFVENSNCQSLKKELRYYDPEQHNYLLDCIVDEENKKTLVHFVLDRIDKDNFKDNFCIVDSLIKYHPEFKRKFDGRNLTPLDYVDKLPDERLTSEQKQQLVQLLAYDNDSDDNGCTHLLLCCLPFLKK